MRARHVVYLTFDDGPRQKFTPVILDELAEHGVRATFFQEGRWVRERPDLTTRAFAEGHAVGNHAWSHPSLPTLSEEQIHAELRQTSEAIATATGQRPTVFRPPYGHIGGDGSIERERSVRVAKNLGMRWFLWTVDSYDYKGDPPPTPAEIVTTVTEGVAAAHTRGEPAVVLLHDDRENTAAALGPLLSGLRMDGIEFETLPPAP
jgi:peptidoglycan/xylan/chitin deacetylase (PgdA/CDA1 family)